MTFKNVVRFVNVLALAGAALTVVGCKDPEDEPIKIEPGAGKNGPPPNSIAAKGLQKRAEAMAKRGAATPPPGPGSK